MSIRNLWRQLRHRPDFFRDPMEGQMTPEERRTLYEIVRKERPETVFEIGTWKGGGSTYILSSALYHNCRGILYTIESMREFYEHSITLYDKTFRFLKPCVRFHFGNSIEVYPAILEKIEKVDVLFLDGAEDDQQTLKEYRLFESKLHRGSIVMCHDWKTLKTKAIRPIFTDVETWEPFVLLEGGPTGFAAFRRTAV